MRYETEETLYGPFIRYNDWSVEGGRAEPAGGCLFVDGTHGAKIVRNDYPHGGGGDVTLRLSFTFEHTTPDSVLRIQFHTSRDGDGDRGFTLRISSDGLSLLLAGEETAARSEIGTDSDPDPGNVPAVHTVECVTLGDSYAVLYDSEEIGSGRMTPPYTDNEGWTALACSRCNVMLTGFEETAIRHDLPIPEWTRNELLYEETFGKASFESSWICNNDSTGGVEISHDSFLFRHMSNSFLRERYRSPIAVDYTIRPVPTGEFSSGVTDAIVIWMADRIEGDFFGYLEELTSQGTASLLKLLPCPFYWVDFGGTNNVTTRLRKNPYRHLMRQYTDPPRLLERGRSYDVTAVQNGRFVEFLVDGKPMIRQVDEDPLTEGHVGVRAYCADTELLSLRVWSLES